MNTNVGRKGKRGPTSPAASVHSPPIATSPLPKIKLNIRPSSQQYNRPPSASSLSRPGSSSRRRGVFSDDGSSSSDLTPAEDDDDDDEDDDNDDEDDNNEFPSQILSRNKGKKRESLPSTSSPHLPKGRQPKAAPSSARSTPRPSAHGPNGRDRKRHLKLGEVARRRARDDKFGFGGDRFGGATPTQSRISNPALIDSDSTSSYGDDESEREMTQSLAEADETEDEYMGGLHEAFAGHEIEDLAYGAGHPDSSMEDDAEMEWWNDNETENGEANEDEDDEEFIANLTGSDIDQLQSQSSVHASSDDPMSDSTSSDTDDACDEFGFSTRSNHTAGEEPLVLMENWDGQFVLVQPRQSRRRERGTGSRTAGSIGESTTASAGEQHLIIDDDANDDTDSTADWSGVEDNDGGDTTDSMAEEDMPVLDSPALDQIIGQQMTNPPHYNLAMLPHPNPFFEAFGSFEAALEAVAANPSIVITDVAATSPSGSTPSTASATTPGITPGFTPGVAGPIMPQLLPMTPVTSPPSGVLAAGPVMGTFTVSNEPCESAVIDGSKTTTKSPFTRRRRHKGSDSGSVSAKRRPRTGDPFSPVVKKTRYSSIPGHPRFIAARRAAQALMDPLERETTPSEEEHAFSLDDMLNIPGNDLDTAEDDPQSPELRHLFRFDKIPVSTYMRRNFSSGSRNRTAPSTPSQSSFSLTSTTGRAPNVSGVGLSGTLAGPLPYPASRMLISPVLQPTEGQSLPMSRKERRRARKGVSVDMHPLQI
ncbi:hypothetical protein CC85DRAFT_287639 [Cutaneotrichosporon oleaginosum]|uniref:Uncharacterized protein n=1 Tax=Cutaneotrichosporon oleaginosum TaxID=879819 RepID=A0A0J0XGX1_9TREE|nr:uncharacterized protein CC85DRAFT_287639 [Cutaneotrichosporon oleaginosum]KLT40313.1 hypothetical protein CC85DRAFT_287639 [Cutaneotrichosporon oleaginosum]TXT07975.1 hypothetical protein COLE_04899 [Cutaneotrichosporon oleaginosum]